MIEVESLEHAFNRTLKILINTCAWEINFDTLYVDYVVYRKGDNNFIAVGWQWDNKEENFTRCVKVHDGSITDYYHSYEKYDTQKTGIFSYQVDPNTEKKICQYIITDDGVHKYDMEGNIIQENNGLDYPELTKEYVMNGSNLFQYKHKILLVSNKPYGDIVYIDVKDHVRDLKNAINRYRNK